jgi:DNA mismatch repair protein PMS2
MVGDALKQYEMVRIVKQMSTMDNPWSCPHGRPTIRHLGKIDFELVGW